MSEITQILPVLDLKTLQDKANEHAMAGAIATIKEFYTGWNSPFRKSIEESLGETRINGVLNLPDIIGLINTSMSEEIDKIANAAIAESFIPLVKTFLLGIGKELKFSDILKEFIDLNYSSDYGDFNCYIEEQTVYEWLTVKISGDKKEYNITLHKDSDSKKQGLKKYHILSLPYNQKTYNQTMKLKIENASLELPFTRDILQDRFVCYIGRIVMAGSIITMDVDGFESEMFPERCRC